MGTPQWSHEPVLLDEVLAALAIRADGCYLDATFGRGGHTQAVLQRLNDAGRMVALDRDPTAIAVGRARFADEPRLQLVQRSFAQLQAAVAEAGVTAGFDGVLFDLGVSSPQLDDAARGFSFMQDGPLDMRMDNSSGVTAAAWLAKVSERDLLRVVSEYGEERFAKRITAALVQARNEQPIATTAQLAKLVSDAVPTREPGKHPATRTFQAIRIAVNAELEQIDQALRQVIEVLKPGGRLCVISFHSLEDQRVKKFMQQHSQDDPMFAGLPHVPPERRAKLKRVGGAIHPTEAEIKRNPRARSSILRVASRVQEAA
ncbi:MAG: 16S rRNA (cytosine(1402)-N(4))-methyltransferase RsmH [Steroidobacteraceae bacterium]